MKDEQEITKEIDCSAFRPEPLNVKEVTGALSRAIRALERAGDHMRDGVETLKQALGLMEKLE